MNNLTSSSKEDIIKNISYHTKKARESFIQSKSLNYIDGNCHENAIRLSRYLYDNTQYKPYIRWGVVDYHNRKYTDLKNAEDDGVVHFWVEIPIENDNWVYADIFSMSSVSDNLKRGEIYVSNELPETYLQLDNTLFRYRPEIKAEYLVSYEDYFFLKDMLNVKFQN